MIVSKFGDRLTVDAALFRGMGATPGDRIWLGADALELKELSSEFSYVLAARVLEVSPDAVFALAATPENPIPSAEIFAREIRGALSVSCDGARGADGAGGTPGEDGALGGDGGRVFVRYAVATEPVIGSAKPGPGGAAGKGGPNFPDGLEGIEGRAGTVDIGEASAEALFPGLPAEFLEKWRASSPQPGFLGEEDR